MYAYSDKRIAVDDRRDICLKQRREIYCRLSCLSFGICAPGGKSGLIPVFSIPFPAGFFIGYLTSFFNSELSGTIFACLGMLRTVQFFKNFQTPYFMPGPTKITGQFPDW